MMKQQKQSIDRSWDDQSDGEIGLLDYWQVIWKRRYMIGGIVIIAVFLTGGVSLFMTNRYQARAVIMPVMAKDGGSSGIGLTVLAQQLGGLPGIPMPTSTSAAEIVSLLKSNILREKIIRHYNLLPVLFYKQWDSKGQTWRKDDLLCNSLYYLSLLSKDLVSTPSPSGQKKDLTIPDTWDALRLLGEIVKISQDVKQNTITISVEFHDPDMAARIVEYFLVTLTNYMSSEAKRVAATNRKHLEQQLEKMHDPFIRQKTYNMITQQIETGMMAEVKENFAFKVIDPPLAPDRPSKPKRIQMMILALFIALLIGIFAALFKEYLQNIRTRK